MIRYDPKMDPGQLEDWPFDNPASCYQIIRGTPRASGRIDHQNPERTTRTGIWRCTAGAFQCIEQGDELMTVLSGHCLLTDHDTGQTHDLNPGDTLFIQGGTRVTWDVLEDITKVFYGHKLDGY